MSRIRITGVNVNAVQGGAATEPAPAPAALPEGCQVQGAALRPQLYVSGGGECGAGGAQLISGCGGGSPCQGMLLMI